VNAFVVNLLKKILLSGEHRLQMKVIVVNAFSFSPLRIAYQTFCHNLIPFLDRKLTSALQEAVDGHEFASKQ
jgi:hypothetical protein